MAATSKTKCALGSSTAELGRARGGLANQCLGFRKCTVGTPAQRFSSLAVLRQGIAAAAQELAGPGEEELAKRAAAAATALRHDSAWCCRNCANAAKASLPGLFAAELKAQVL